MKRIAWISPIWLAVLAPGLAGAQAIERNLPQTPTAPPAVINGLPPVGARGDDRPLGVTLRQIVVLGPGEAALPGAAPEAASPSLVLDQAPRLEHTRGLRRFLGQPLSMRRISQIEAEIVRDYRRAGRPFVDVSTPPQDLSGGRLQVRVIEYRLGKVAVTGTTDADAQHIRRAVRAAPGQPIDAGELAQDLDWLNRYPFRALEATFTPGAATGETDLHLTAKDTRPFSVYAGYANSGSPDTGEDRYFVGASLALPWLRDATASYQLTGSPDFWDDRGRLLSDPHPAYLSQGGRLLIPTAPRQDVEVTLSAVETNQPSQAFVIRSVILEASLGYRLAASDLWSALPGDLDGGIDLKREHHDTLFGGVSAASGAVSAYQAYLGWAGAWTDPLGRVSLDASVHVSPGGLSSGDTDAAYLAFTQGRVRRAEYAYVNADLSRATRLPLGLSLASDLAGQWAGQPLPDTERLPLGGVQAVRGYTLDDGAYDDAITLRNELRLAGAALFQHGAVTVERPYFLADVGVARDDATHRDRTLAGVGVGASARVGPSALTLTVSDPLASGPATHAGAWRADVRLTVAY